MGLTPYHTLMETNILKIIYRVCPHISTYGDPPIYKNDKFGMVKATLSSLRSAVSDIKTDWTFICDSCPGEWLKYFRDIFPHSDILIENTGNIGTYLKQVELASEVDGPVLLQEDDYIYRKMIGKSLLDAIHTFDFVSPYDHLDHYMREDLKTKRYELRLVGDQHWRTVESNTLTFASTGKVIRKNYETLTGYGIVDEDMWKALGRKDIKLWTPIPSMATHLASRFISPSVDWNLSSL